jgi:hypothetical protein
MDIGIPAGAENDLSMKYLSTFTQFWSGKEFFQEKNHSGQSGLPLSIPDFR